MSEVAATLAAGLEQTIGDKPFWAKCRKCAHCWPVAYLPMDIGTLAKVTKNSRCPRCGDGKPVVAKQNNGTLNEPLDPLPGGEG